MDAGNVSAIISAAAGITGVLLGNAFVWVKEWGTTRQKDKRDISYAGILLISHLDRFATECLEVARDDGTRQGQPAGEGGECQTVTTVPVFNPLDIDINWKLLPKDLMYSIIRIPDYQDKLHGKLSAIQEYSYDPPDHPEFFWTRQRGYAVLGLEVSKIISRLAEFAGLPEEKVGPGEWSRDQDLEHRVRYLDELERRARGL
ncbi:hypothetical protein [Pseudomonas sp. CJQ_13]|uniref:hypothetical protein n=1 Tax=Pseudomonas sp. CJQ_13 TaxID=3367170 RepID=UPI00370C652D